MSKREHYLWAEKYRPHTVDEMIVPESYKRMFRGYVEDKNIPNLLMHGPAGTGKTTAARALCDSIDADYIVVNGSNEGRSIETLRNQILDFASTVSFGGGRKYVIFDEADYLNPTSFQPALRNFMDEYSRNTGFIFTCNYKEKIIEPLHSRCASLAFKIPKSEAPAMAAQFLKRCITILNTEGVEFDKKVLIGLISSKFPDYRSILNTLQEYSSNSKLIDTGILSVVVSDSKITELFAYMKKKDFTNVRKWVTESECEPSEFFSKMYDEASRFVSSSTIPVLTLIIAKYMYQHAFVSNPEINLAACAAEIMVECEFT